MQHRNKKTAHASFGRSSARRSERLKPRLSIESLENRCLLATITVTSLVDDTLANLAGDAKVSLREAIEAANTNMSVDGSAAGEAAPVQDEIVFQAGLNGTILMLAGQFSITETVKITGNGANNTVIDGQTNSRVLDIGASASDVTLDSLAITRGMSSGESGGGIRTQDAGVTLTITNCVLANNQAASGPLGEGGVGGGILNRGTLVIANSTLSNNLANFGGGISNSRGAVTITNSTLSGNSASLDGGGINNLTGEVRIVNSTLIGNTALEGGGVFSFDGNGGASLQVINSTISGNRATGAGGGILSIGFLTVVNSTIHGNSASDRGGGILTNTGEGGDSFLFNSIVTDSPSGGDIEVIGDIDGTNNYVGDGSDGLQDTLTVASNGAINLAPLADNGGPTMTHALCTDVAVPHASCIGPSPALDRGNNSMAVDPGPNQTFGDGDDVPLTTDQRGGAFQRIKDGPDVDATETVDIGAYEVQVMQVPQVPLDYGDAPQGPPADFPASYPTKLADDGARHLPVGPTLGSNRDAEADGQPTPAADGDDTTGTPDDEDGVVLPATLVARLGAQATVTASAAGKLDAWIDFNRDGDWDDAGERITPAAGSSLVAGANSVVFVVPAAAVAGQSFARFRLSSTGGLAPRGEAPDGEVEDYEVQITPVPESSCSQLIDPANPGQQVLACAGSNQNEKISFQPFLGDCPRGLFPGSLLVTIGSRVLPTRFPAVGRIVVFGLDGDDFINLHDCFKIPLFAHGGAGKDTIRGGGGHDVLEGGPGDDDIQDSAFGRDFLIGGEGKDKIKPGRDEDILVAGTSDYDLNDIALVAIMKEWTRTDATYTARTAHLRGSMAGGLNGTFFLKVGVGATVHDDGVPDLLDSGAGRDWSFARNLFTGIFQEFLE